jgi:hypothetical protein
VSFIVLNFESKLMKSKETGFLSCLPHSNLIKAIDLQFLVLFARTVEGIYCALACTVLTYYKEVKKASVLVLKKNSQTFRGMEAGPLLKEKTNFEF